MENKRGNTSKTLSWKVTKKNEESALNLLRKNNKNLNRKSTIYAYTPPPPDIIVKGALKCPTPRNNRLLFTYIKLILLVGVFVFGLVHSGLFETTPQHKLLTHSNIRAIQSMTPSNATRYVKLPNYGIVKLDTKVNTGFGKGFSGLYRNSLYQVGSNLILNKFNSTNNIKFNNAQIKDILQKGNARGSQLTALMKQGALFSRAINHDNYNMLTEYALVSDGLATCRSALVLDPSTKRTHFNRGGVKFAFLLDGEKMESRGDVTFIANQNVESSNCPLFDKCGARLVANKRVTAYKTLANLQRSKKGIENSGYSEVNVSVKKEYILGILIEPRNTSWRSIVQLLEMANALEDKLEGITSSMRNIYVKRNGEFIQITSKQDFNALKNAALKNNNSNATWKMLQANNNAKLR